MRNSKIKLLYILLLKVFSIIFVATKTVFINRKYVILAVSITIFFWIILNYLEQLIFFYPYFVFYYPIPLDALPGFIVSNITALLLGLVLSLNVYILRTTSLKIRVSRDPLYKNSKKNHRLSLFYSLFSGSSISIFSSACSSCTSLLSSLLLPVIGVTGGATVISILDTYHMHMRIISLFILVITYYYLSKRIMDVERNNMACSLKKE